MQAIEDTWFIGDKFLKGIFPTLQNLKTQAVLKKRTLPYIYEYFNISCYVPNSDMYKANILVRTQNAIIEAFNSRVHLPKYLIVILDKDILESAHTYSLHIRKLLSKWTDWIAKIIEKAIASRRENLFNIRPGAVAGIEPKVIWLKMIDRPEVTREDDRFKIYSMRNKLNAVIEGLVSARKNHHYIAINSLDANKDFQFIGELNQYGQEQFWKEFDHFFKKFDRREISLKTNDDRNALTKSVKYHLPAPPPQRKR